MSQSEMLQMPFDKIKEKCRIPPPKETDSALGKRRFNQRPASPQGLANQPTANQPTKLTPIEDDFTLEREIGAGAFARVFLGHKADNPGDKLGHLFAGQQVAVKVMSKADNPAFLQEIEMLHRASRRRHVMPLLAAYETDHEVMLVTPHYSGCDLYEYAEHAYETGNQIAEEEAMELAAQMINAAEALHRAGVVHLDIKPENFMFSSDQADAELVLVDFGSAEPMKKVSYADTTERYDACLDDQLPLDQLDRATGTASYLSPEVAAGKFSSRSDVFSVGVCLYTLLTGLSPFATDEPCTAAEHMEKIQSTQESIFEIAEWEGMSKESTDIVQWMLRPEPERRCSTTEALVAIKACLHSHRVRQQRLVERDSEYSEQDAWMALDLSPVGC
jgi:calcium-dependent protein kinase